MIWYAHIRRPSLAAVAFVVATALTTADEPQAPTRRVVLGVSETAGIRRFGYPVSLVLPLPDPVKDTEVFRLLDGDKPVTAQFRPHGDADKGIRAVSLDFNVNHGPLERHEYVVEYGRGVAGPKVEGGLRVETTEKEFRIIHPSGLLFAVPRELEGMLNKVQTKKTRFLNGESTGLILRTKDNDLALVGEPKPKLFNRFVPTDLSGKVVKEGPLAVGLRFECLNNLKGRGQISSVVEMEFPISKSWVRVHWTVDDPRGDVASLGAELNLHVEGEPTLFDFGAGTSVYGQLRKGESARLRQNPATRTPSTPPWETFLGPERGMKAFVVAPGSTTPPARNAEGWVHVMDSERCTALAVADFGAGKEGAEITVYADGRLRFWKHFGGPGESAPKGPKQITFWLHFVSMPVHVGAATSPQAMLAPLQVEILKKR
jgi:hypothetical protein